jgi:alanyl-tRNA synthetase
MNSSQIRQAFLDYFDGLQHTVVKSSSLVPENDPTLLFTNAGMVQFKDAFLGAEKRPYVRAVSTQRCVRAGGKHNDLENVGYTARHHTFFEMLGNFSFGDYFKQNAIRFAWDFLTVKLALPKEKLWVTVYKDDDEAAGIWEKEIGVPPDRITRLGESSNFWSMGDTGPCGPCSEIFYDHGPEVAGGPPGSPDEDGDRYIEIWNLVFMQFNRNADGKMTPLPEPSVDTGMGLERISAIMQGVHSNYEIDLFQSLIKAAAEATATIDLKNNSLKVIADHIRSSAFLIGDGVHPSNEGRGYVLRRIIRRAIRHGHKLGQTGVFFSKLVAPLASLMGEAYPELAKASSSIAKTLLGEEEQFARTLDKGMSLLEEAISKLDDGVIPGDTLFKLYDTYGFPVDLTADIARERGLQVDLAGFEEAMEQQRELARAASKFDTQVNLEINVEGPSEFLGYEQMETPAKVLALFTDSKPVKSLGAGQRGVVILDRTTLYAESGGQVGDHGHIVCGEATFVVEDTQKQGKHILHLGKIQRGTLNVESSVQIQVTSMRRQATMLNHSATHLMHAALREVLGTHVTQKGSLVTPQVLRFDFSHNQPVSQAELAKVEDIVNAQIQGNFSVQHEEMGIDEAKAKGAMALFGEKYGDTVRVITMGEVKSEKNASFSVELCGGTHVKRTGDIGLFRITQESGIAAGVRRIEAVTGLGALQSVRQDETLLGSLSAALKTNKSHLAEKLQNLLSTQRAMEKELQQLKSSMVSKAGDELLNKVRIISGHKVLISELPGLDGKALRNTADQLRNKLGESVVVLACQDGDKVNVVVAVSKSLTNSLKAGELVSILASYVGGKGGGRPDLAMAGGINPAGLGQLLEKAPNEIQQRLS